MHFFRNGGVSSVPLQKKLLFLETSLTIYKMND